MLGLAWAIGAGIPAGHAAELLEDQFAGQWYYTEVVVFQRPAVMDHLIDEALARPPSPLPRELRWLEAARSPGDRAPLPSTPYELDPATRAYLTFPYLDQERLGDLQAADPFAPAEPPAEPPEPAAADLQPTRPVPVIEPRLAPDPLLDFLRELAAFESRLLADSYRWLPEDSLTLTAEARRLARGGQQRVLLHGRWLQPVPPRAAPEPLLFRTGDGAGWDLEGVFAVTIGRFLHVDARLYYREPLLGRAPLNRPQTPVSREAPASREATASRSATASLTSTASLSSPEFLATGRPGLAAHDLESAGVMELRESRRLRSGELHYLDHPKLGVLVRVEPVTPPESLSAAFAALQADLEEGAQ